MVDQDRQSQAICDRCGGVVPPENDARQFEIRVAKIRKYGIDYRNEGEAAKGGLEILLGKLPCHLLPVPAGKGVAECPGSPSRAQYFEGYPRDERGTRPYQPENEPIFRAALKRLQEELASS